MYRTITFRGIDSRKTPLLSFILKQAQRRFAFFKMVEKEHGSKTTFGKQVTPEQFSMQPEIQDSIDPSADPLEASLPPSIKSLLDLIRQQSPTGPVVHNGERGLGSNW